MFIILTFGSAMPPASKSAAMKSAKVAAMKTVMVSGSKTAMKKVVNAAMKKVMKTVLKRPSAPLNKKDLDKLGEQTLDEKIATYQKKGNGNIDSFLGSLAEGERQALWQRFKYARLENVSNAKNYDLVAKGAKSMDTKKKLLNIFLQLGQSCKGQPYVDALVQLTISKGQVTSQEWVPFATIMKKYGLQELMRRVRKGSVQVRSDPEDPEEYEFRDVRKVETESHHESNVATVSRKDKISIEDYLKVKSAGSLEASSSSYSAAQGFMASVKNGPKPLLALGNGNGNGDGTDPSNDGNEDDGDHGKEDKELETKAELLTQFKHMGPKGKTASQRVDEMLDIMTTMLGKHPKTVDKDLHAMINKRVIALQNLKKNKKLDLDSCKSVLMDAAATIKKVNKLQ